MARNGQKIKKGLNDLAKPFIFMARPARFERATYGFVVRHSIQLSYGRLKFCLFISHSNDDVKYFIA
jgi:hypothetical protein